MAKVLTNGPIAPDVYRMVVEAPDIARYRKAGQFVMVRPGAGQERIPLTIADADATAGTVTLIYQVVGRTTAEMSQIPAGGTMADVAGPLGQPTHIEKLGTVVMVGGGIGVAPAHPIAQAMKAAGNKVISILGARRKDLMIMEPEMRAASDEVVIVTDDGSYGTKGFVTDALRKILDGGEKVDEVVAIGPPIMMKMVSLLTQPYGVHTLVSLNTIMVDGTGMCGACRVSVGAKTLFGCVDGPDFDGHEVDFEELMSRQRVYADVEREAAADFESECSCRTK
jgi:NAD(P)H-flavin reductase